MAATTISTFCIAFHTFVGGNRRDFKFGMWDEHTLNPSLQITIVPEVGVVTTRDPV